MPARLRHIAAAAVICAGGVWGTAEAAAGALEPPELEWSFEGIFGTFDRASAQRGFQVYKEVCSACHAMQYMAYRHLSGIGFSEDEIKAIAADIEVPDGPDEFGEFFTRPATPADFFAAPFPNDQAARAANGGALPPDLTLITKAKSGGANYVHAILIGYDEPPGDVEVREGLSYNPYFTGAQIAMAQPLFDDMVEYADGTEATVEQMAHDVATFLAWAAEPELEERKRMGFTVVVFLVVLTALLLAAKRKLWADLH
ncbi:MAG: cytochrome c1 [Alphaproteobacteria bacterium]